MTRKTNLHQEDFIEMLKRGDSPIQVADYSKVTIRSIETRFYRLPAQVRQEIINVRRGIIHWHQLRSAKL